VVCALDTELLGHWWYEGVEWLRAVVSECAEQGLALVCLDDAAAMRDPAPLEDAEWATSTWGTNGDLSTWSGAEVADMAFVTRAAELQTLARGGQAGTAALRELLALQASDWAFMVSRGLAVPYARERFANHRVGLERALASGSDAELDADVGALRNLAVHADPLALLSP
jgi:1,4-alpha-glucan branching enzyme